MPHRESFLTEGNANFRKGGPQLLYQLSVEEGPGWNPPFRAIGNGRGVQHRALWVPLPQEMQEARVRTVTAQGDQFRRAVGPDGVHQAVVLAEGSR